MNVVVNAARNIEGLASKIENDSLVRIRDLNDLFLDWIPARDVVMKTYSFESALISLPRFGPEVAFTKL